MEDKNEFKKILKDTELENVSGGTIYYARYLCGECHQQTTLSNSETNDIYSNYATCPNCGKNMVLLTKGTFM